MIKLLSSAALGFSVVVALSAGSAQANDGLGSFGLSAPAQQAATSDLTHVMERFTGTNRRDRLGYTVEPRDFSISHLSEDRGSRADRSSPLYRAGQFLFRR